MDAHLLTLIIIVLGLAVAVQLVCSRIRLPSIVGFLITGFVAGPGVLHLVPESNALLAELGVVLLLFTIGAEFSFEHLAQMRRYVLLGGAFQVLGTILAAGAIMWATGTPANHAVFYGYMVAMSSSAILFRMLQQRGELEAPHGRLAIGISIFQDLASVVMMLSLPVLAGGDGSGKVGIGSALLKIAGQGTAVLVMVWLMARYIVPALMRRIAAVRSRELFLLATLLLCLGIPFLVEQIGLPLGIGAFLAGLIIAETEFNHQALAGVMPFKDVFSAVFFISIGILLNADLLLHHPLLVAGLAAGMIALKLLLASGSGLLLGFPIRTALRTGLLLANTGEFTFVLAALGLQNKLLEGQQYQVIIAITVLSMAATPLLLRAAEPLTRAAEDLPLPDGMKSRLQAGEPAEQYEPGRALKDHLVVIGYGVIGRNVVRAAQAAKLPLIVIEMNHETAARERAQGLPILAGDATQPTLLEKAHAHAAAIIVVAVPDPAETRKIVDAARAMAPKAHLIARTRYAGQVDELLKIGANDVVPDEFEAAVAIIALVLRGFLIPREEIDRELAGMRHGSYQVLRQRGEGGLGLGDLEKAREGMEILSVRVRGGSALAGRTLAALDLRRRCGVTLLAIRRSEEFIANPTGEAVLEHEDVLVLYGSPGALAALQQ